jgi:hypothetical protein
VLATGREGAGIDRGAEMQASWKARGDLDNPTLTLALSTGGHAGPTTALLERLGYAASLLGREETAAVAGGDVLPTALPHLGGEDQAQTRTVVERSGLPFFVVGLQRSETPGGGPDLAAAEERMFRDIAPATILVSDLCVKDLGTLLEKNAAAWPYLLMVIGRPCGSLPPARHIYSTLLLAAPEGLTGYARATLTFDFNTRALLHADGKYIELPDELVAR